MFNTNSKGKVSIFINKVLGYIAAVLLASAITMFICIALLRPEWLRSTLVVLVVVSIVCFVLGILLQRFFCNKLVRKLQAKLQHKNEKLAEKDKLIKDLKKQLREVSRERDVLNDALRKFEQKASNDQLMQTLKALGDASPKFNTCEEDDDDDTDIDDDNSVEPDDDEAEASSPAFFDFEEN